MHVKKGARPLRARTLLQHTFLAPRVIICYDTPNGVRNTKDKEKLRGRLCAVYTLLMCTLYLLFFWTRGYSEITVPKYVMLCILCGGFVAGMIFAGARPGRPSVTELCVILYWVFTAVSTVLSPWKLASVTGVNRYEGLITVTLYTLVFLLISRYASRCDGIMLPTGAALTLFCCLCIVQLAGFNPFGLYPEGMNWFGGNKDYVGQYIGTVGNAGFAAALLSMALPALLVALARGFSRLLLIPALLSLAVLVLIGVDAGYLAAAVAVLACLPVVFPRRKKLMLLIFASVCAAGAILVYFFSLGGFLSQAHEVMHGNFDDSFGSGRIFIWKNVIPLIPERPLFGGGPDTLVYRMTVFFQRGDITRSIDTAHNEYLNILVNQGVFALAAYLGVIISALTAWLKNGKTAAAVAGAAVLGYCIQAFFGISMFIVSIYFWIALGYLSASRRDGHS